MEIMMTGREKKLAFAKKTFQLRSTGMKSSVLIADLTRIAI
jgi:hypothetical protein